MDTFTHYAAQTNQKSLAKRYWKLWCNRRELHLTGTQVQIVDVTDLISTKVKPLFLGPFLNASWSSSESTSMWRKLANLSGNEREREQALGPLVSKAIITCFKDAFWVLILWPRSAPHFWDYWLLGCSLFSLSRKTTTTTTTNAFYLW